MSQSVERAARILLWLADCAADGRPDRALKELADSTGLDKATAHRLASALAKHGLVRQDELTRRYQLGPSALRLGRAGLDGHVVIARCMPALKYLQAETGETVSLSERQGLQSVTIYEIESRQVVRYANKIGRSAPLHVAAGARAILAFSDDSVISAVLNGPLEASTDSTIVDPNTLKRTLAGTRRSGYAKSFGERTPGVHSLAAPILDADGTAIASISILWPSRGKAVDGGRLTQWPELLLAAVTEISGVPAERGINA